VTTLDAAAAIRLREISPAELPAWDEIVRRFSNHRMVHTMAWVRSLEASGFGRSRFLVFEKGEAIVGCLPGLLAEVGPFRLFGSPPPASQTTSMGPAFDAHRVTTAELMEVLLPYLEHRLGVDHMEIVSPTLDPAAMLGLGFRGEPWLTYRVPLFPGDEARTMRVLKDSARRNISRGIKQGLEIRFESSKSFVDEHYDQIREVYARRGEAVNFRGERVLECFSRCRDAGSLLAISVYLPSRVNIATGMFTMENSELLLWTWARRTKYRWHRPIELMTWSAMQRALRAGCETFDLTGVDDFKAKFGTELDCRKYRWMRSRYRWLAEMRDLAAKGLHWRQALWGRAARWGSPTLGLEPVPTLRSALRR
jgi:hypothetical protein